MTDQQNGVGRLLSSDQLEEGADAGVVDRFFKGDGNISLQLLDHSVDGLARSGGGAGEDQVRHQFKLAECFPDEEGIPMASLAEGAMDVGSIVGICLGLGVPKNDEGLQEWSFRVNFNGQGRLRG